MSPSPSSSPSGWSSGIFGQKSSQRPLHIKALVFIIGLFVFYPGVFFIWSAFERPYIRIISSVATFIVNVTQPNNPFFLVSVNKDIVLVIEQEKNQEGEHKQAIHGQWIQSNLILTLTLILATPGIGIVRRLKLLLLAMGILFSVHVVDLVFEAKRIFMSFYGPQVGASYALWHKNIIFAFNQFFRIFRTQFVPFAVWGGLCYGELFQKMSTENTATVSRNAPCPCGSGRKYKHCCGKI